MILGLFVCVGVLVGLYLYMLSASVVHVVVRKEVHRSIVDLKSEIGELEAEYIAAQHRVSSHVANLDGYISVSDKIFVDRTPSSLVLSTTNDRTQNER